MPLIRDLFLGWSAPALLSLNGAENDAAADLLRWHPRREIMPTLARAVAPVRDYREGRSDFPIGPITCCAFPLYLSGGTGRRRNGPSNDEMKIACIDGNWASLARATATSAEGGQRPIRASSRDNSARLP